MADLEYSFTTAAAAAADSELMNRPNMRLAVNGQLQFLGLALKLGVPIFTRARNIELVTGPALVGSGVSSTVYRYDKSFTSVFGRDIANAISSSWFEEEAGEVKMEYVTKKLSTNVENNTSEAQRLASIVNEIRILSTKTLRQCRNISRLFGISWLERVEKQRYWPQLVIEVADLGTLHDFMRSKNSSFRDNLFFGLDILSGLNYLHVHGVVHCDLKPANILVFPDPTMNAAKTEQVMLKLCDFGCSVILSDYDENLPFQARIGTRPWTSPELDEAVAVELPLLHKSDIYSFGLIMASMFMNGRMPFDGLKEEDVLILKLSETEQSSSSETIITEILANGQLNPEEVSLASMMMYQTLLADPSARFPIDLIMNWIKFSLLHITITGSQQAANLLEGAQSSLSSPVSGSLVESLRKMTVGSKWGTKIHSIIKRSRTKALEIFSRSKSISSSSEELYKILTKQQYIQPDPILQVQNPQSTSQKTSEYLKQSLIGIGNESTTDGASDAGEDTSVIDTIPDFCFEGGFVPSLLPRVAVQEVFEDLQRSAVEDSSDARILFHLCGCYFNGVIATHDAQQGMELLQRAANLDHSEAMIVLYNILQSCKHEVSDKQRSALNEFWDKNAAMWLLLANINILHMDFSWKADYASLAVLAWASACPQQYLSYQMSRDRVEQHALILHIFDMCGSFGSAARVACQAFDFSSLVSYNGVDTYKRFSEINSVDLETELREQNCLELVNSAGFTILQEAVVHADYDMVAFLIDTLKAGVDNTGATPGWTPLWLACYTGQLLLATKLIETGAHTTCADSYKGLTILHLLNQFPCGDSADNLLQRVFSSDSNSLDVNMACKTGYTPLHTTFHGWDFSGGSAARSLLRRGANPTIAAPDEKDKTTAIELCALALDYRLLKDILNCPYLTKSRNDPDVRMAVTKAKAEAFRMMIGETEFFFRAQVGHGWYDALQETLKLLVDEDMECVLSSPSTNADSTTSLVLAIQYGRRHICKALVETHLINFQDQKCVSSWFRFAVEYGMNDIAMMLIDKGANMLVLDKRDSHSLHHAAHYNPPLLAHLIERLESMSPEMRQGKTTKEILEMRNQDGFHVLGLLLAEGAKDQLELVNNLKVKFDIDLDASGSSDGLTLSASLIVLSIHSGLVPLSQFQYLVDLNPRPRFVCKGEDVTLLDLAVSGPLSYQKSPEYLPHHICRLILEKYWNVEILSTLEKFFSLHHAAAWGNIIALGYIKDHIDDYNRQHNHRQVSFHSLANARGPSKVTALDFVAQNWVDDESRDDSNEMFLDEKRRKQRLPAALECYKFLRELGCLHSYELKGMLLSWKWAYTRFFDWNEWERRMYAIASRINVTKFVIEKYPIIKEPDLNDPDVVRRLQESPGLRIKAYRARYLELVWYSDDFALRTFDIVFSPLNLDEDLRELLESRLNDGRLFCTRRGLDFDLEQYPWSTQDYEQKLPGRCGPLVTWTRHGKVWSTQDSEELRNDFQAAWNDVFGEDVNQRSVQQILGNGGAMNTLGNVSYVT